MTNLLTAYDLEALLSDRPIGTGLDFRVLSANELDECTTSPVKRVQVRCMRLNNCGSELPELQRRCSRRCSTGLRPDGVFLQPAGAEKKFQGMLFAALSILHRDASNLFENRPRKRL